MEEILTEARFQTALASNSNVIAYFTANWCGKCRLISPCVESSASKHKNVKFIKVDMDTNHFALELGVTKLPHVMFYLNGSKTLDFVETDSNLLENEILTFASSIVESQVRLEAESKISDAIQSTPTFSFEYISIPSNKVVLNLPTFNNQIPMAIHRQLPLSIDALQVSYIMNRCISCLFAEFVSQDGKTVRYSELASSLTFRDYINATHLLSQVQFISNHSLMILTDVDERKAFFLNLYNSLTCHAKLTSTSSIPFYSSYCYMLGDDLLSLDDIEHGILRGNSPHPSQINTSSCHSEKEIIVLMQVPLDARIHCNLNCGAKSCPPIRIFNAGNLNTALTLGAKNFLSSEVEINLELGEITTSKIFFWYQVDFQPSVIEWMKLFVSDRVKRMMENMSSPVLKYRDYDWKLNET